MKQSGFMIASAMFVIAVILSGQAQKTVWDGVFTEEQAKRGADVYAEKCAMCHGDSLGGVESAPALTGPAFYANWEGETLNALFERIRMSMPQDNPGSLSRTQNAEIIASSRNPTACEYHAQLVDVINEALSRAQVNGIAPVVDRPR